jgi:hypothetical protein
VSDLLFPTLGREFSLNPSLNATISTEISSPLKSKFSRADRYDRDFERSEFKIQTPEPRDCTQLPVHERSKFYA